MTPKAFLELVAKAYGVTYDELISPQRSRYLVNVRAVAIRCLRYGRWKLGFAAIGDLLGGRDHTSAMNLNYRGVDDDFPRKSDVIKAADLPAPYRAINKMSTWNDRVINTPVDKKTTKKANKNRKK